MRKSDCEHKDIQELSVAKIWQRYSHRQSTCDPCPWWGCEDMPPRAEEIQKALDEGRLQSERNDINQHLGDREWHIERVAYLVKNWQEACPIRMKKPMCDMDIDNGAHRLMAARHLKKATVQAYEK